MSKNTGTSELINYFDLGANGDVGIAGSLDINTIANATTDTDTFLVSDTGIIKYRTGAQLLSDIGAQSLLTNPVTGTGAAGQVAYWTGTNTQTGNSNFFWDNSTGRLRVNSSTANSNLTVSGSDNTDIFTLLSGVNSRLHVGTVTSPSISTYIRSQNNYALDLGVNSTNYLTILSSGNVGINTATPATAFEVNGVGLFSGTSLVGNTKNGIYIYDQSILSLAGTGPRPLTIQGQTLSIYTGTTYSEKLKVFENGNVVISTSPSDAGYKLDVNGTGKFSGQINANAAETNTVNPVTSASVSIAGGYSGIRSAIDHSFNIDVYNSASPINALKITQAGEATFSSRVGIGVSPSFPLHISSNIGDYTSAIINTNVSDNGGLLIRAGVNSGNSSFRVQKGNGTNLFLVDAGGIVNIAGYGSQLVFDSLGSTRDGGIGYTNDFQLLIYNSRGLGSSINLGNNNLDFNINVSGNPRLRITGTGNILINTTTDSGYKLQVNGASYLDGYNYASSIQYTRAVSDTVNPAGGNGILIFSGGQAAMRMSSNYSINFDMFNGGDPFTALTIKQANNTVRVNSPNNTTQLEIAYQNVAYGYLGATSSFSGALLAYSVNGGYVYLRSDSAWVAVSDRDKKKNFVPYKKGLNEICSLKPTYYQLKTQDDDSEISVGLIAQEVGEILSEAYSEEGDFKGIAYNTILVTMINAIKELKQQLDTLTNENN